MIAMPIDRSPDHTAQQSGNIIGTAIQIDEKLVVDQVREEGKHQSHEHEDGRDDGEGGF